MQIEDAVKLVKRAIVLCELRDLPRTKEAMAQILLALESGTSEDIEDTIEIATIH